MKKFPSLFSLLLISLSITGCTSPKNDNSNTEYDVERHGFNILKWSDEFDGDTLNLDNWSYQIGTGSEYGLTDWGNSEGEYYKEDNISVRDGNLIITAKKEDCGNKKYTSGRIRTCNKVFTTYGRIEAKISLPEVVGMWPAFWMLPEPSTPYGGWASSGEIDIMEARGRVTNSTSSALHYGNVNQDIYKSSSHIIRDESDSIVNYHVYAVEWNRNDITFYVDDDKVTKITNDEWFSMADTSNEFAPFDVNFHIILNLAIGGHFDGFQYPDETFTSCEMKVDYVRIYEKGESNEN